MLADEEQCYGAGAGMCADDRADEVDINVLHTELFTRFATYSASARQSPWLMNTVWSAG